jgi:YD repeat-containing protein
MSRLPAHTKVLDLGTGNGALPRLLLQAGTDLTVRCEGVDVADAQPQWIERLPLAQRERVRIHSRVSCEALPFSDASFGCVVSQFGVEYADLDRALPEALRVLQPGGSLRLAIHHAEGRPARLAREEVAHAQWLQQSGWLEAARDMSLAMSLMGSPEGRLALNTQDRWQAVRQTFDGFQRRLAERAATSPCPDLLADAQNWLTQVFQAAARQGEGVARSGMGQIEQLLQEGQMRLQDLLGHVVDRPRIEALAQLVRAAGHAAVIETAEDNGHLMGWWLTTEPS